MTDLTNNEWEEVGGQLIYHQWTKTPINWTFIGRFEGAVLDRMMSKKQKKKIINYRFRDVENDQLHQLNGTGKLHLVFGGDAEAEAKGHVFRIVYLGKSLVKTKDWGDKEVNQFKIDRKKGAAESAAEDQSLAGLLDEDDLADAPLGDAEEEENFADNEFEDEFAFLNEGAK